MQLNRAKQAVELHKQGCNCTQAVVCAYCDLFGLDKEIAFRIAEGFGGGMGAMRDGVCGAVTGMYMLAGMKNSCGSLQNGNTKKHTYEMIRTLRTVFQEKNKTIICKELLGQTDPNLKHSCNACIEDAGHIVETILLKSHEENEYL